ncbi:hypothetical protein ACOME3_007071 [Neoechinorhynchus agilis]
MLFIQTKDRRVYCSLVLLTVIAKLLLVSSVEPAVASVNLGLTGTFIDASLTKGDVLKPCQFNEQCNAIIGLICHSGICVCPDDKYWKQNKCLSLEGALEDGSFDQKCLKPEECNQVVGLTCIRGRCKCARHSKWNGFYCTIDGTILNCHWYN